jgi:hypothetical protein
MLLDVFNLTVPVAESGLKATITPATIPATSIRAMSRLDTAILAATVPKTTLFTGGTPAGGILHQLSLADSALSLSDLVAKTRARSVGVADSVVAADAVATERTGERPHESWLFPGGGEHANSGHNAAYNFAHNDAMSAAGWIQTVDNNTSVISKRDGGFKGWWIGIRPTGHLWFAWFVAGGNVTDGWSTTTVINSGAWTHWALTKSTSPLRAGFSLYVNGVPQALTGANNSLSSSTANAGDLRIASDAGPSIFLAGNEADVSIYNTELSPANITTLYNGGNFYDQQTGPLAANLVGLWEPGTRVGSTVTDLSPSGNDAAAAGGLSDPPDFVLDDPYP